MASIIKTDNIQTTGGANIINQCSTTITLGASGDSVVLGSGATASGFGRSGGVNYCTTAKTTPFTAANGSGYFVNTTSGAITVTLPASPSAGAIIALKDYGGTWQTNNVTLCNNGSKINGVCATAKLSTQGQSVTLIYVDATKGWQDINDSTSSVTGGAYVTATGGTITTCGNYKIHTFTSDGTFCVSEGAGPQAVVDYLVVAGGAGGSSGCGGRGGGGAGGFRESKCATTSGCWTASPLASATSLPVSVQAYPVTVGGGGSAGSSGGAGSNSIFSTITSTGGGGGASPGGSGGSGGGGNYTSSPPNAGSGNTPPVSPPQGNPGGSGSLIGGGETGGGGGGGSSAAGSPGPTNPNRAGSGGAGITTSINATPTAYGGGGNGQGEFGDNEYYNPSPPVGGGGYGNGGAGAANKGAGGAAGYPTAGAGGSGIVIIRYKYQ